MRPLTHTSKAILLIVSAMLLLSCMDALAKGLSARYHPFQVVWARYTSQTLLAFIFLAPQLPRLLRTRYLGLQMVRSGFLFGGTLFFFTSIWLIGLARATAIFEINPLIVTVAAFFFLHEKVGIRRFIGVGIGLLGALIIIRPGLSVFTPYAFLPMIAAACYAGYAISTRFLGSQESAWTSFLYTTLVGAIVASMAVPWFWSTPSLLDMGLFLAMGAIGGVSHILLIRALMLADVSVTAPFTYVGVVTNTLWGVLLYNERPDLLVYVGALVIVFAGLYVWHRELRAEKPFEELN